jgi:hypothetical protein
MKRKALLAFAAAGAITTIVVLATGAFAGTSRRSDPPGDSNNAALVSCLASHGVQVPSNDPGTEKLWLGDHQSDPAVHAALDACAPNFNSNTGVSGSTPAELAACLVQHGVDVPNDVKDSPAPGALKEWLHGAMQQPSVKAAIDAC